MNDQPHNLTNDEDCCDEVEGRQMGVKIGMTPR